MSVEGELRTGPCCLQEMKYAAAANPSSKLKLRTQEIILTSTEKQERELEDQIYSILLLSLKQKFKCR